MSFAGLKRRTTKNKSGFKRNYKPNECKLLKSKCVDINARQITLNFEKKVKLIQQFKEKIAVIAVAGYVKPFVDITLEITIKISDYLKTQKNESSFVLKKNRWNKFGGGIEFDIKEYRKQFRLCKKRIPNNVTLTAELKIIGDQNIGKINFFGVELSSVTHYTKSRIKKYESDDVYKTLDTFKRFHENPKITIPERYFFTQLKAFGVKPISQNFLEWKNGTTIILKRCNSCGRFLLIDLEDEHSDLCFSRHCIEAAPCTHSSFSDFEIDEVGSGATKYNKKSHCGFQLECKICKKFVVNATGNARRSRTQLHEDSLNRRAMEDLVGKLTDRDTKIFVKTFPNKHGIEFVDWLEERFDWNCFHCGKPFSNENKMHVDHTRSLAKMWPLGEDATALCGTCNSSKSSLFPVDFYSDVQLQRLSEITGIALTDLKEKSINEDTLEELKNKVVWFFDEFLMEEDYQKEEDGKKVADKVYDAIQKNAIKYSKNQPKLNLIAEYEKLKGEKPKSISIDN